MKHLLCFLAAGLYLCLHVNAESRQSMIDHAVRAAKATVDNVYEYSRRKSVDRVKRNVANPSDVLRLLKQPTGQTRTAVRAADYMHVAVKLLEGSLRKRSRRSINATDLLTEEELAVVARLTGCSPRHRAPSCTYADFQNTFRTASSTCSSRINSRWGASNTPFARWLPAEYEDGVSQPKGWTPDRIVNGFTLPLVRDVSNRILKTATVENDELYTHLLTIFGQWLDHDLTFTPHSPAIRPYSNGMDCDQSCERTEPCFPIEIPEGDPKFSHRPSCMTFFRSSAACGSGNTGYVFGASTVRRQINSLTAFIDAGQLYGSDEAKARFLRDFTTDKGLLRVNTEYSDNGRELLPFINRTANMCATRARITGNSSVEEVPCFVAGDERSNENIALSALHTLMVREHNRLARALSDLNPHWDGERLYQEARKIVGAYFQVITYRDYLKYIVGPNVMDTQLHEYPGYDENVDPSIANVFATAAYRFAHLAIQPFIFRLDEEYQEHTDFPSPMLHKAFFTPWRVIFEGGLDPILRGLVGRPAKLSTQAHMMHNELRERLFQFSEQLALDLASLNLQRGRDHGLPGYNQWRRFCDLSAPNTESELAEVMGSADVAHKLMQLYGTPENIDVWLGGVLEPFVEEGRVGDLFACLISTQFKRIRQGDRLWWENPGVFTNEQRLSLRKVSLARILCDNTGITRVPYKPFQLSDHYAPCDEIATFDLTPWKDNGGHYTQPKVAFSVRLSENFPTPNDPIVFQEVIYNGQKSYDTETGIFTCPQEGVYEFHFHCTIHQNAANVDLMHNGEIKMHLFATRQNGYIMASDNIIIKLSQGDQIWLVANSGGNGMTRDSFFSGHLLFVE